LVLGGDRYDKSGGGDECDEESLGSGEHLGGVKVVVEEWGGLWVMIRLPSTRYGTLYILPPSVGSELRIGCSCGFRVYSEIGEGEKVFDGRRGRREEKGDASRLDAG
jgi:hypothetical protein